MPNTIKYSTNAQTLALKQGNYWIGTGDVEKGPTSTTDYWNGITPPSGGYTIYLNKASNGPSIYTAANDSALISLTNSIAGASYTTVAQCFNYFRTQNDKMVFNRDYEAIVTNGLVLCLDAGFRPSYTTSGTTWYNLSPNDDDATLINGPTFSSDNGGSIVFDGTDDYVVSTSTSNTDVNSTTGFSFEVWVRPEFTNAQITSDSQIGTILASRSRSVGNHDYRIALALTNKSFGGDCLNLGINYILESTVTWRCTGPNAWTNNAWNHIVSVQLGTNLKIYVNNILLSDITAFTVSSDATAKYYFGNRLNSGFIGFPGKIAINRVYNRALSATEVLQNFNAQKARFGL